MENPLRPLPENPFDPEIWEFSSPEEREAFLASDRGRAAEILAELPLWNFEKSFSLPADAFRRLPFFLKAFDKETAPLFFLFDRERFGPLMWYEMSMRNTSDSKEYSKNHVLESIPRLVTGFFAADELALITKEIPEAFLFSGRYMSFPLEEFGVSNKHPLDRIKPDLQTYKSALVGKIADPFWDRIWQSPKLQRLTRFVVERVLKGVLQGLIDKRLELVTPQTFFRADFFVPGLDILDMKEFLVELGKAFENGIPLAEPLQELELTDEEGQLRKIPGTRMTFVTSEIGLNADILMKRLVNLSRLYLLHSGFSGGLLGLQVQSSPTS